MITHKQEEMVGCKVDHPACAVVLIVGISELRYALRGECTPYIALFLWMCFMFQCRHRNNCTLFWHSIWIKRITIFKMNKLDSQINKIVIARVWTGKGIRERTRVIFSDKILYVPTLYFWTFHLKQYHCNK